MRGNHGLHEEVQLLGGANPPVKRHHTRRSASGIGQDSGLDHVPILHAKTVGALVLGQNKEVVRNAPVKRSYRTKGTRRRIASQKGERRALQHGPHTRNGLGRALALHADLHLVAVHGLADASARHGKGALGGLDACHARPHDGDGPREQGLRLLARPGVAAAPVAAPMWPFASHVLSPIPLRGKPATRVAGAAFLFLIYLLPIVGLSRNKRRPGSIAGPPR